MAPAISIIVPIYDVEDYLEKCINSIVQQSMQDIEIILVDDGSPDRCGEICDSYADVDSRIRVVHQNNRGLSVARNVGITIASGKYLMFVDSDDWVDEDFCWVPYQLAEENNADLVIFSYYYTKKTSIGIRCMPIDEGTITNAEAMWLLEEGASHASWNKLYKKELFQSIQYPERMKYEDIGTTYKLLHKAKRIVCTNTPLYHYNSSRTGQITANPSRKDLIDKYYLWNKKNLDLAKWGYNHEDNDIFMAVTYLIAFGRNEDLSQRCEQILRNAEGHIGSLSSRQKAMVSIYSISPMLFDLICRLSGKRLL